MGYLDLGRFEDAVAVVADNFDVDALLGVGLAEHFAIKAVVTAARGHVDEADLLIEEVRQIAAKETDRQFTTYSVVGGAALLDLVAGRLDSAAEGFLETFRRDQAKNLEFLARGALAAVLAGDTDQLQALKAASSGESSATPMRQASLTTIDACLAASEGTLTAEQAAKAVQKWTDRGWILTAGLCWIAFANAAPEIGSQLDAAAKARAIFEPIGADGILALLTRSMVDM
jgi:hypothetical protein